MSNEFVWRSVAATLCAAGVLLFAAASPPGAFAQQAGAHRASAAAGTFHLWWNSEAYILRAALGAELRGQLDAVWAAHKSSVEQQRPDQHRSEFYKAVNAGDWKLAQTQLSEWAGSERALVKARGDLQVAILSLLSEKQLAAVLRAGGRSFLRQPWRAKMNWPVRGRN